LKTEVATVPLGMVQSVFHKYGVSESETITLLTFLVKIWLANEHDVHEELTKDTILLMELDELTKQMFVVEVLPLLIPIATSVHDSQEDRAIIGISIKPYSIVLEYIP